MKILSKKEAPLLNRKKITAEVEHPEKSSPSNNDVKATLSKLIGVDEKLIAIRHVYTKYGESKSKIIAHVYKDEKTFKELESSKEKKENVEKPKENAQEKKKE